MNNTQSVTGGTIARTICLGVALGNSLLVANGVEVLPIENEQINLLVSTVATVATAAVAWWKNNSFTKKAIAADSTLKGVK